MQEDLQVIQRPRRNSKGPRETPEAPERLMQLQIGPDKVLPDTDNNSKMVSPVMSVAQVILPLVPLSLGTNTDSDTDTEILCSEEQPTSTSTTFVVFFGVDIYLFYSIYFFI